MTGLILQGNSLERLRELPDDSVHCVITSPPYYALRDYGTGTWHGGDPECDHVSHRIRTGDGLAAFSANLKGGGHKAGAEDKNVQFKNQCGKCGALREDLQLGMEATPEEYIANMVALFREVHRVLRPDGTLWLNIGDSYASRSTYNAPQSVAVDAGWKDAGRQPNAGLPDGCKQKDLIGIPWMLAFALRGAGWYLRQDIIWNKSNPMPESVGDRCTKAHEYLFLLTKSPRYFYDAEAIKEDGVIPAGTRGAKGSAERASQPGVNSRPPEYKIYDGKRNKRSVWTVSTKPFKEAHFATFPTDLIEPCILAGTSEQGVCGKCGAPWQRLTERRKVEGRDMKNIGAVRETVGWAPTCDCDARVVKPIVLDPFFGAGTTGLVAERLGRNYIGCELNPEYVSIAKRRIAAAMVPTKTAARRILALSVTL